MQHLVGPGINLCDAFPEPFSGRRFREKAFLSPHRPVRVAGTTKQALHICLLALVSHLPTMARHRIARQIKGQNFSDHGNGTECEYSCGLPMRNMARRRAVCCRSSAFDDAGASSTWPSRGGCPREQLRHSPRRFATKVVADKCSQSSASRDPQVTQIASHFQHIRARGE